jgi:nucleoside-diphosphate-sugar epimerase
MTEASRKILVLGASGLIGRYVTDDLRIGGFETIGVARSFSASQCSNALDLEMPVMEIASAALARLLRDRAIDGPAIVLMGVALLMLDSR